MRKIVLSIETTGFSAASGDRLVEVAALQLTEDGSFGEAYHRYINPGRDIDDEAIERHGITPEFLADKPSFSEIYNELKNFLKGAEIVVYDESYTIGFLKKEFSYIANLEANNFDNKITDILSLAVLRHPNQHNTLESLFERYYIDSSGIDAFGALLDAYMKALLYRALLSKKTKKQTSDLSRYKSGKNLVVVNSFSDFDAAVDGFSKSALCRGVSNHEYPLLPSLFRHSDVDHIDIRESNLMWVFKTHSKPHLDRIPSTEVEWLTIAQHHGLPTRLLDWSLSPLVACFFAVQSLSEDDAAVYIYDVGKFKKEEDIKLNELGNL